MRQTESRMYLYGLIGLIVTCVVCAIVLPYAIQDPDHIDLDHILEAPSHQHWMGTDDSGRDVLARMVYGMRVSLGVAAVAVLLNLAVGIVVGLNAGYWGGRIDRLLSRLIEIVMCFPTFFLILALMNVLEPGLVNVMIALGLTGWTGIARLVRTDVLKLRTTDFVVAARTIGASPWRQMVRHILPQTLAPIAVALSFGMGSAVLAEASLSFLGFGVQPPTSSWGQILSTARQYADIAWWMIVFPGLAIFLTVLIFNELGESLRSLES